MTAGARSLWGTPRPVAADRERAIFDLLMSRFRWCQVPDMPDSDSPGDSLWSWPPRTVVQSGTAGSPAPPGPPSRRLCAGRSTDSVRQAPCRLDEGDVDVDVADIRQPAAACANRRAQDQGFRSGSRHPRIAPRCGPDTLTATPGGRRCLTRPGGRTRTTLSCPPRPAAPPHPSGRWRRRGAASPARPRRVHRRAVGRWSRPFSWCSRSIGRCAGGVG